MREKGEGRRGYIRREWWKEIEEGEKKERGEDREKGEREVKARRRERSKRRRFGREEDGEAEGSMRNGSGWEIEEEERG